MSRKRDFAIFSSCSKFDALRRKTSAIAASYMCMRYIKFISSGRKLNVAKQGMRRASRRQKVVSILSVILCVGPTAPAENQSKPGVRLQYAPITPELR